MTSPTYAARILASEALAKRAVDMPEAVLAKARLCLVDYFSNAYEARNLPWSQQAAMSARQSSPGAVCIARRTMVAPGDAAFANAASAHGLVREDMHTGSVSHFGVVIWPALLAELAQSPRAVPGHALLAAAIAGYEAGAIVGRALMTAELARLFRPTGLLGPLAAAVALSHLRGLDVSETASAIAFAVNCAGGLNQWPGSGSSDMYFHPGFAARNALLCVDLAQSGAIASPDILEGEAGLFRAFGRKPLDRGLHLFAGGNFEILNVFHKSAPACNYAQTPSQAALNARRKVTGGSETVTAIRIEATQAALLYPGCDSQGPYETVLQAKMSIQYGVAAAIARGRIDADNYADIQDAEIARLVLVATLEQASDLTAAYPQHQPARVSLHLDDGSVVTSGLDDVVMAGEAEILSRFRLATAQALGHDAAAFQHFVETIDETADARHLEVLQLPDNNA